MGKKTKQGRSCKNRRNPALKTREKYSDMFIKLIISLIIDQITDHIIRWGAPCLMKGKNSVKTAHNKKKKKPTHCS